MATADFILHLLELGVLGYAIWQIRSWRHSPRVAPPIVSAVVGESSRACEACGVMLPTSAVKTHDGHWRCAAHKNVVV